jgi:hypothetical protein
MISGNGGHASAFWGTRLIEGTSVYGYVIIQIKHDFYLNRGVGGLDLFATSHLWKWV